MGADTEHPWRVLMLTASYHPRLGGVEKHVRRVARELCARGLKITIATPRWESDWPEEEELDGCRVTRLSRSATEGRRQLRSLLAEADLVHTHDAYPFLKYYLPFRLTHPRLPVYITFHGYEGYPIPLEARVLRRVVLWLTRGSLCAGSFIPKWYGFRCKHITHGGVDAPAERPALGEGAVFVGRLEPDTGFLKYLDALRVLREAHGLQVGLQVIGDGSLREQGEALALEAGLDATFHGRVADPAPYLVGARYALVSGFLAILDAMAAGSLVLAVYDNPLKEDYLRLFPGAQHIVIASSAAELAERLAELEASAQRREALAAAAFKFAREQTWGRVADLYLDLWGGTAGA